MSQRPFYLIAHRCNTLQKVEKALQDGANAVECDVINRDGPWIAHDSGDSGTSLDEYLKGLKNCLNKYPQFALLIFDNKIVDPSLASRLLEQTRIHLTNDTKFNIIISVPKLEHIKHFEKISQKLIEREGIAIDQEDRTFQVSDSLRTKGVINPCYANGLSGLLKHNMIEAVLLKANYGIKFVYVWTITEKKEMRDYLRIGVDGIFVDNVKDLDDVLKEEEFKKYIRLAGRDENPFMLPLVDSRLIDFGGNTIGKPITNLKVQTLALDQPGPAYERGWDFFTTDINKGVKGKHIYIGYQTGDSSPVTSVDFVAYSNSQSNPPPGWEWDGSDLNEGAKGKYIYLLWKKGESKPPIVNLLFLVTKRSDPPTINEWTHVGVDLNEGAGDPYIWAYYSTTQYSQNRQ